MYNNKFGLKMRNTKSKVRNTDYYAKSIRDRAINSAIICILILIAVMSMKIANRPITDNALATFGKLVKSQSNFDETADAFMGFITQAFSSITGREVYTSGASIKSIAPPLKSGKLKEAFVAKEHPVFQTLVSPTGIEIQADPGALVYAPGDASCDRVITNANGTKRLVASIDKNFKVVYDNLKDTYVEAGDKILENSPIGIMGNEDSVLTLQVYVDNEPKNPLDYIGEIY